MYNSYVAMIGFVVIFVSIIAIKETDGNLSSKEYIKSCPLTKTEWGVRSRQLNCSYSKPFHCLPVNKSTMVEICMKKKTLFSDVGCPWFVMRKDSQTGRLIYINCPIQTIGCPAYVSETYLTSELYKYPKCLMPNSDDNNRYQKENPQISTHIQLANDVVTSVSPWNQMTLFQNESETIKADGSVTKTLVGASIFVGVFFIFCLVAAVLYCRIRRISTDIPRIRTDEPVAYHANRNYEECTTDVL